MLGVQHTYSRVTAAHPAGSGDQPHGEPPQALPLPRGGGEPPRTARSAMATACAAATDPRRPADSERGAEVCSSMFPYCPARGVSVAVSRQGAQVCVRGWSLSAAHLQVVVAKAQ